MSEVETATPHGLLSAVIEANTNLTEDEACDLASLIQDVGFVSIHHNIASQIADWIGYQAEYVTAQGDVAEWATPVPGETGRAECIQARDSLHESPGHWMHEIAGKLEKGCYL